MTGKELLELLQSLSEEELQLTVYSEGCDCTEEAVGVYIDVRNDTLQIARHTIGLVREPIEVTGRPVDSMPFAPKKLDVGFTP
jgi:hypothetical protein